MSAGPDSKRTRAAHRARWREHMESQRESGLSAAAYCLEHGLYRQTFYRWRRVFKAETNVDGIPLVPDAAAVEAPFVSFAELRIASEVQASDAGVEIVHRIRGSTRVVG